MENLEDTFTVSVIGNGLGVTAGAIQDLIRDAHLKNSSVASGLALAKITVLSVGAEGFTVAVAVQSGDPDRIGKASTAAIASIVLSTIGAIDVGVFGAGAITAAIIVGGAGYIGSKLGNQIWEYYKESVTTGIAPPPNVVLPDGVTDFDYWSIPGGVAPEVSNQCNRYTTSALNWVAPRPPGPRPGRRRHHHQRHQPQRSHSLRPRRRRHQDRHGLDRFRRSHRHARPQWQWNG
ncbi:hypothetical protein D3C78_190660 [compost metagenome]